MQELLLFLVFVLSALLIAVFFYAFSLKKRLGELVFSKQSLAVKHGKIAENWIPFSNGFPVPPEKFRFLGNPVDGIAFLDEKILFVEFKIGNSRLSKKQKKIRGLVENKKVEFMEYRVE